MAQCGIVTAANEIIASVRALQIRAEVLIPTVTLPDNLSSLCGDGQGLINEIYSNTVSFVLDADGDAFETVQRPVTPYVQQCHTGIYLAAVRDWIDGIQLNAQANCSTRYGGDFYNGSRDLPYYFVGSPSAYRVNLRLVAYSTGPITGYQLDVAVGDSPTLNQPGNVYYSDAIGAADFDAEGYFVSEPFEVVTSPAPYYIHHLIKEAGSTHGLYNVALICDGADIPTLEGKFPW